MQLIPFDPNEKLACITLDYEPDYGGRINGAFNILAESYAEVEELAARYQQLDVPVSSFIVTQLLEQYPASLDTVRLLSSDFHAHSHTHARLNFDSYQEIPQTRAVFERYFGAPPLGYRAPFGKLYAPDYDLLQQQGFAFSSSVFPGYRPGVFNNLDRPIVPYYINDDLMEIPLGGLRPIPLVLSLSYMKFLGFSLFQTLCQTQKLPHIIVFLSHLHDYIVNPSSFNQLPRKLQVMWGRNKYAGVDYFTRFVTLVKRRGYRFITMTQLYQALKAYPTLPD